MQTCYLYYSLSYEVDQTSNGPPRVFVTRAHLREGLIPVLLRKSLKYEVKSLHTSKIVSWT